MQWLSTAFQLVLLLLGVLAAWIAMDEARSLRSLRSAINALEHELEGLDERLRKLSGRFYASQRNDSSAALPIAHHELAPICENYTTAQRDGPTSKAALCECAYCSSRRAERDAFRAQVKLSKHAGKADGQR